MIRHLPNAEPGQYVPIDYHFVGAMPPAAGPDYRYVWIDRPEFLYELGDDLGDGLYALRVFARDQSDRRHGVEIAAGLAITGATERSIEAGVPMWFLNNRIRYRVLEGSPRGYAGVAYGRLRPADAAALPQRWLFGAPN
jgi:hypothetical protein